MKIIGILLIIGILFSYVPILPMDDSQESNHAGNMKLDCGLHLPLSLSFKYWPSRINDSPLFWAGSFKRTIARDRGINAPHLPSP
jgi:hypothetical protein